MNIKSLGFRTDLIFPRFDGEITDHGDHIAVRTPSNPTFYWGNFLLFADPPRPGDIDRWTALFARDIGVPPAINHIAIGWDTISGERGDLQPFLDAGYEYSEFAVLTATVIHPSPKHNDAIVVRPVATDSEWQAVLREQVACRDAPFSEAGYTLFKQHELNRYRAMADAGLGHWFGAFLGEQLVGDLGVFVEDGVGRFQHVVTHPDFRRRGIAGTLVYHAAQHALAYLNAQTLVIVAEAGSHAAAIYESLGFQQTEIQVALTRSEE